ncbi:MAG TPA: hypothetical protein VIG51_07970 [Candidatus Baltobacteraceae bacterium]|jgi:hypothetical protein
MSVAADPIQLRPLGLGEIFDRAVTLYVRNFAGFSIIALFLLVPISIANYFALNDSTSMTALLQQMQHPHPGATPALPFSPALVWLIAIGVVLTPFANVATATGVARLYARDSVDWRRCYGSALRRWPQILLVLLVQIAIFAGAAIAGALGVGICAGLSVALFAAGAFAGVVGIVVTVAVFFAWLAVLLMLYLAAMFMFDAVAIEAAPLRSSIASGFDRIFNRVEFKKALLVGISVFAIQLGFFIIASIVVAVLESLVKSHAIDTIAQGVLSLLATTFLAVLIAVYYYDVRVRREGLDLQTSVEQMIAGTQPQA